MNRFFTEAENIREGSIFITHGQDVKHISKVLRLKKGDCIEVSDGMKWEYVAEIVKLDANLVECKILDKQAFAAEPGVRVTLFQGVPKQGKMELIIQKTVELGVHAVVPVFTTRSVVTDNGKFDKKIDRWQKIADEAVKQCKRGVIPQVEPATDFDEMCKRLSEFHEVIFPYENEDGTTIKDALSKIRNKWQEEGWNHQDEKKVALIIGPEGGFSQEEAEALRKLNTHCVSLGKTILRTETAGMAALAMVMYELEL